MLRSAASHVPVVGVEPDFIAAAHEAGGRASESIVFATRATLALPRYRDSAPAPAARTAISIPAPELVLMVERGVVAGPEARRRSSGRNFAPWPADELGAVVLGCTHFIFLRPVLSSIIPGRAGIRLA